MASPGASRWAKVLALTVGFAAVGFVLGSLHASFATVVIERPAAHRIPMRPGATPLSIAMIYDTVHGLHPEHGPAWHRAVEARARRIIAGAPAEGPASVEVLDAHDDLAVALDRLARPAEGLAVLADKLERLRGTWPEPPPQRAGDGAPLEPDRRAWYRLRANRGTLRIHLGLPRLMGDPADAEARRLVDEGLADIRASIALDRGAHFGRERWQAYLVAALLKAIDDPWFFREFDLIGLRHDSGPLERPRPGRASGMPTDAELTTLPEDLRARLRERVPAYLPDPAWAEAVGHPGDPVPFDEPALALVGMWLYGGGANPHSALALGDLMDRIDQPVVAWSAYARAEALIARLGPLRPVHGPHVEAALTRLTEALGQTADELHDAFRAELERGEAYREAQAAFEAGSPDPLAPDALRPFFEGRPDIRTPPGQADRMFVRTEGDDDVRWAWVSWMAALGAWLAGSRLRREGA